MKTICNMNTVEHQQRFVVNELQYPKESKHLSFSNSDKSVKYGGLL